MSDLRPIDPPRAHGLRIGAVVTIVALAFAAGLVLMGLAVRGHWLDGKAAPIAAARQTSLAVPGFTPAQPLSATGDAPGPAMIDPAALATREAALAGQLTVLEARTAAVTLDAGAAAAQAARAEGLLVAFAARRALDRGLGLGYLEEQLRTRFGQAQPRAVTIVVQAARQPVTLEDLRQGLDAIAPDIGGAGGRDWVDGIRREFGNLVVLRQAGTPSPLPTDRLARARRLLEGGQVDAARAEIARLPGVDQAANWLSAARRYIVAREALDAIESAALIGPPVTPAPPQSQSQSQAQAQAQPAPAPVPAAAP